MFSFKNVSPLRIKIIAGALGVFVFVQIIGGTPAPISAQHTAPPTDNNAAMALERAQFTKLRPDLDAHEYWARRCQPYRDRAASLPSRSLDAGFAMLAITVCTENEGRERDFTASTREYFEKGNGGQRLAMPASLASDAATHRNAP